ncbi:hypothetical protein NDU88_006842 [Pleurodeles waltl]|uniref:Uncharacterized protein n=1 Tax=Pleurodeles waltl TaxID=8319 RepID=A0AAV7TY00_PLEWA|nr:hypothetical protein NDU88_006842 [Pleurodeles waltl]
MDLSSQECRPGTIIQEVSSHWSAEDLKPETSKEEETSRRTRVAGESGREEMDTCHRSWEDSSHSAQLDKSRGWPRQGGDDPTTTLHSPRKDDHRQPRRRSLELRVVDPDTARQSTAAHHNSGELWLMQGIGGVQSKESKGIEKRDNGELTLLNCEKNKTLGSVDFSLDFVL